MPTIGDTYTVLAMESFDYWDTIASTFWNPPSVGSGFTHIASGVGRRGSNAGHWQPAPFSPVEWSLRSQVSFPTSYTWMSSGIWLACASAPNSGLYLMSHGVQAGFLGLTTGTGGKLEVWDFLDFAPGSRVKVAETAAGTVHTDGTWDRIEWYTHRGTASGAGNGTWAIYVNGVLVLTGTREIWWDATTFSAVWFGVADHNGSALNTDLYMDDIYSIAGDDTVLLRTLGDWAVDCRFPSTVAQTISGGFTAVGSATTPGAIDDTVPDDDTSYATGAIPRGEDYTLTAQPSTGGMFAVRTTVRYRFTVGGISATLSIRLQNAGVPWFAGNTLFSGSSSTSYAWGWWLYTTRPGGTNFTPSDMASLWPGIRYGAGSGGTNVRITQLVTEVLAWNIKRGRSKAQIVGC